MHFIEIQQRTHKFVPEYMNLIRNILSPRVSTDQQDGTIKTLAVSQQAVVATSDIKTNLLLLVSYHFTRAVKKKFDSPEVESKSMYTNRKSIFRSFVIKKRRGGGTF
jgi:hypothetical protein